VIVLLFGHCTIWGYQDDGLW